MNTLSNFPGFSYLIVLFCFVFVKTVFHVAQAGLKTPYVAGLELLSLLSSFSKCWDYSRVPFILFLTS